MKRVITVFIVLLLVLAGCSKGPGTSTTNTTKMDDRAKKVIDANVLKTARVLTNPNSLDVEATARASGDVTIDKNNAESFCEKFIEYAATNSLTLAMEELNKAKTGNLKAFFPKIDHYYIVLLEKNGDIWKITAHGLNRDFIGVDVVPGQWKDLTQWPYLEKTMETFSNTVNAVWTTGIFWKDPDWSAGKTARFDAYNRKFSIEDKELWIHYTVWVDG